MRFTVLDLDSPIYYKFTREKMDVLHQTVKMRICKFDMSSICAKDTMKFEMRRCWQTDGTKEQQIKKSIRHARQARELIQSRLIHHL